MRFASPQHHHLCCLRVSLFTRNVRHWPQVYVETSPVLLGFFLRALSGIGLPQSVQAVFRQPAHRHVFNSSKCIAVVLDSMMSWEQHIWFALCTQEFCTLGKSYRLVPNMAFGNIFCSKPFDGICFSTCCRGSHLWANVFRSSHTYVLLLVCYVRRLRISCNLYPAPMFLYDTTKPGCNHLSSYSDAFILRGAL